MPTPVTPEIQKALDDLKLVSEQPATSTRYARVVRKYIAALLDELEHYKSREVRVTTLVHDNQVSWDELAAQLDARDKRIAEVEAERDKQGRLGCALFDEVQSLRRAAGDEAPELRNQLEEADAEINALQSRAESAEQALLERQKVAELDFHTVIVSLPQPACSADFVLPVAVYTHETIIDCLASHPRITLREQETGERSDIWNAVVGYFRRQDAKEQTK